MKEKKIITIILISIIFIVALFTFIKTDLPHNLFKLKADVQDIHGAVFDTGKNVNTKMKKLAGNTSATTSSSDENITKIKRSNTLLITPTDDNIVSSSTSEVPIYMWYDNGTIYWYTEEENPKLNPNSTFLFVNLTKLETIDELNEFDTSKVTSMYYMFSHCENLTSLDLSNFNTNSVTTMWQMFSGCSSLTNLDLSNFDTSKVTNMESMFENCKSLSTINLSGFNTGSVTNMVWMFSGCSSLTNIDLSSFDTSNVTDMRCMFSGCSSLTNLDLSNFNTSNVTSMVWMFNHCSGLTSLNISNFNASKITGSVISMFSDCSSLTTLNMQNFIFPRDCHGFFQRVSSIDDSNNLKTINLDNADTSKVTDMSFMFCGCGGLTNLNLSSFDTSNVENMSAMFQSCIGLTTLNISSFNTSNVINMSWMFLNCKKITSINLSSFDTSNVTDMFGMFQQCESLPSLSLINFNTSSVTSMQNMFAECYELVQIAFGKKFDTSNVTKMSYMFYRCNSLEILDLSSFNTSKLKSTNFMFGDCYNLKTIYVDIGFTTKNIEMGDYTFDNCPKLVGGSGTTYDSSETDETYAKIDGGTSSPGYFTAKGSSDEPDIDNLTIKEGVVILTKNSTKKTITDLLGTTNNIKVFDKYNNEIDNTTKICTGDTLKINNTSYQIAIKGDINKDSILTGSDVSQAYSAYTKAIQLSKACITSIFSIYKSNSIIKSTIYSRRL